MGNWLVGLVSGFLLALLVIFGGDSVLILHKSGDQLQVHHQDQAYRLVSCKKIECN